MKAVFKYLLAGFVGLLAVPHSIKAQYSDISPWELGLHAGTLVYQGDLATDRFGFLHTLKPAIGVSISRKLGPYFSLRGNLLLGKLVVDETKQSKPAYHQTRRFQFRAPITELSAMLLWNIPGEDAHKLTYYLMGGAGLTFTKVRRDWSRMDTTNWDVRSAFAVGLAADTVHFTPRIVPVLPLGAGLRYQINPSWSVNAETVYRFTPSDYLDGFSQSVNAKTKDRYYGISIGVSYRLGADKYRCPSVQ
jgi:opacity protein-like surface antigen